MLSSMTGFGRATCEIKNKKITIEIKSLNSAKLDLSSRVPSYYREKEIDLRRIVAKELERGKIDVSLFVENVGNESALQINPSVMAAYVKQLKAAADEAGFPIPADYDWLTVLLRLPDVNRAEQNELEDEEWQLILETLNKAIQIVKDYRRKEGETLEVIFTEKLNNISALILDVEPFEAERTEAQRQRILERFNSLGINFDINRLEQEMIYYIEKLDINEEKNRLRDNLAHFSNSMNEEKNCNGKHLGFVAQEIGREINTLGSKCNHSEIQKVVTKMKDELEQIKEQVLNTL